jgi:hypothetical protein
LDFFLAVSASEIDDSNVVDGEDVADRNAVRSVYVVLFSSVCCDCILGRILGLILQSGYADISEHTSV